MYSLGLFICALGKNLKEGLVTLEEDLLKLTDELQQEAQCIPNMTHPDVPIGGEDCSVIRKKVSIFFAAKGWMHVVVQVLAFISYFLVAFVGW